MRIYIMTDMEGISGIVDTAQVAEADSRYSEGRALMTEEINVVARACREAGVDSVIVRDCHGAGKNVIWDRLDAAMDSCVIGAGTDRRFPGLDGSDGVILLGYHAMAGTPQAILEHSMSSRSVQNYWINGHVAGEVAIDAAIAGESGVPVIMVSGDDKVCSEARALLPWIETAEVKKGLGLRFGMLLPPLRAYDLLRARARAAIERIGEMQPFSWPKPVRLRLEMVERGMLPHPDSKPYMKIIDGRTYEVVGDSMEQALNRL